MWGFKLTMEEIRDYLARILGVDRPKWVVREQLLRNTSTWSKWYYFDENGTFYHFGLSKGETHIQECWEGYRRSDGVIRVTCWEGAASFYEVELRPVDTETGYQVLSVDAFGC